MLFEAAAEFDALHIKVGNIPGTPCEIPALADAFAELCDGRRASAPAAWTSSTSSCRST